MGAGVPSQRAEQKESLMIFARNPVKGRVKTRLARTVGDGNAYRVYWELLEHTARTVRPLEMDRTVHYTDTVHSKDPLNRSFLSKKLQQEGELGERMASAFREAFEKGYERVVIIGTDCYQLQTRHLEEAFKALRYDQEVVIGPAEDGGYYLLGMTRYIDRIFRNKEWGTSNVLLDTLVDLREEGIQYHLLPTLNDVDEEEDLGELRELIEEA
jgi:rSAM/selenodomain-associated transferase 1